MGVIEGHEIRASDLLQPHPVDDPRLPRASQERSRLVRTLRQPEGAARRQAEPVLPVEDGAVLTAIDGPLAACRRCTRCAGTRRPRGPDRLQ